MPANAKRYVPIIGAGAVVVIALVVWAAFSGDTPRQENNDVSQEITASTPAPTTTVSAVPSPAPTPKKKTLPPEPVFVLPEGAKAIDEYAFVDDDTVYFRSLVSTSTHLGVPGADPKTFRRLQDLSAYPGGGVVSVCGAAPLYTFYADRHRPYFYHIWRAPEFRASHIDVMNGADVESFKITGPTSATDGKIRFDIVYKKSTSTVECRLMLNQTLL